MILLVLRIFMKKDERFKNLTLAEKARLVQGTDFMYTCPVERLGIPPVAMADGPHGLRKQIGGGDNGVSSSEPATAFPTAAAVACSWDPENAHRMGAAIGEECRCYGVHTLLGPGINIKRNPLCGRNFEYYSEDPLLAGKMGAAFCRGVGENGVTACVKHLALNNQENARFYGNSVVDERAVRELYLRPFELTVREGKPHAVMTSYNRINGVFSSENKRLITDILRGEWGFDGIVMSDWGGTFDRCAGLCAGEDLEMPGDTAVSIKKVCDAVADGSLDEKDLDRCVERLIAFADRFATVPKTGSFDIDGHANLAAEIAADSAVLLKNDGILPFDPKKKICVIGDLFAKMRYQGSGSSMINPTKTVSHSDAFAVRGIEYAFARGYSADASPCETDLTAEAVALAAEYDEILLFLGLTDLAESEGGDREDMRLPADQMRLVSALLPLKKKIAVVLFGGSPVELPFANSVNAVLNMYLGGQCCGEACARLLFGETCPSGKLAETWFETYSQLPYGAEYSKTENELYKESVFVGYRYTASADAKPRYPFGFGLSYTEFSYSDPEVFSENGKVFASVTVTNVGACRGAEVVQVYVANPSDSAVFRPKKELRAFEKVWLDPSESRCVTLSFDEKDLSFFDVSQNRFVLENGEYEVQISSSSEDPVFCEKLTVSSGEKVACPYSAEVNEAMKDGKRIDNKIFEELLGAPLPKHVPKLPLTLESPFSDFQKTFMGRILYNAVTATSKKQLKAAKKLPEGAERENRIKGAVFLKRIFDTNCMRTLSMSAGRSFPFNIAEGFVELGNGHVIRGIKAMKKSYKIKEKGAKTK